MKSIIACLIVVCAAMSYAQRRSPYAPNPVGVARVLPRFLDDDDNGASGVNIPSRFGDDETVRPVPPTPSSLAGSNVDPVLANRVAQWPEKDQPFWYLNAEAIRNHNYQPVNALPGPPPRSPFAANFRN